MNSYNNGVTILSIYYSNVIYHFNENKNEWCLNILGSFERKEKKTILKHREKNSEILEF
jgi:hypothetical protein